MTADGASPDLERREWMQSYYFGFHATGVEPIDRILSELVAAGKAFHHTEWWADDEMNPTDQPTYEQRIRSIHPDAFTSEKLAALSPEAERTWWRLQCVCDDEGRVEDNPRVLRAVLLGLVSGATDEQVDEHLCEMAAAGLIQRYVMDGSRFLAVVKWADYQHPNRPTPSKIPCPPAHLSEPHGRVREGSLPEGRGVEMSGDEWNRREGNTVPAYPQARFMPDAGAALAAVRSIKAQRGREGVA